MQSDDELSDNEQNNNSLVNLFKSYNFENDKTVNFKHILKQNELNGVLLPYQTKMMENIFNFKYITASDIMTHRIDILAVDENATINDIVDISTKNGLSRIPVFHKNIDSIIGAIFVKDLLKLIIDPDAANKKIKPFIRKLLYVPKSTKCFDLFIELTKTHKHMAVVVDDFGGTFGIVTMEDIIETIFGQIQDEFDNEAEEIKKINDKTFIIQGFANLKNVFDVLNLEIDQNLSYETLSGFLINLLGHIPEQNDQPTVSYKNIEFSILAMEKHHIAIVKAIKINNT